MKSKHRLIMYSGHCETVGGDARYFLDLISRIDKKNYNITSFTDKNIVFEKRLAQWVASNSVEVGFLETNPPLFKDEPYLLFVKKIIGFLSYTGNHNTLSIVEKILIKILKILTFKEIIDEYKNAKLFKLTIKKLGQIDIFHFNNGGYPGKRAGITALFIAKKMGVKKTIMTVQNIPSIKTWYRLFDHIADFFINNYCDYLICPSEVIKANIIKLRGINSDKLKIIHHGVDPIKKLMKEEESAYKKDLCISNKELILLIVGHLDEERKGHVELFNALSLINDKMPPYKLLVVGDGERFEFLKNLAYDLNISKNVSLLGYRQDIRELNLVADILLQPSTSFEGIPYSIRDAMSARTPIIASSVGGIKESVENGKNGYLVDGGNINQLSRAILSLCKSKERRVEMGIISEKMFLNKFLLDEMVKKHENFYLDILSNEENIKLSKVEP